MLTYVRCGTCLSCIYFISLLYCLNYFLSWWNTFELIKTYNFNSITFHHSKNGKHRYKHIFYFLIFIQFWRLNLLFKLNHFPLFSYKGCFYQVNPFTSPVTELEENSPSLCSELCENYKFIALQVTVFHSVFIPSRLYRWNRIWGPKI